MYAAPPPRRLYYGWWIVVAGLCCTFVGSGIGFYCLGVFVDPLTVAHHWTKSQVTGADTLLFAATGFLGIVVGRLVDRHGPRPVLLVGGVAMASALFLIGQLHALWQLYAVYLWMAVGYCSLSSIPVTWMISRWFSRRRALALSVALAGTSLGGILLVPIAEAVIRDAGFAWATAMLALLVVVIAFPIALFVVRRDPRDWGLLPDGELPVGGASVTARLPDRGWTRSEALRTLPFWAITLAFAAALVAQTAYLIHEISYLQELMGTGPAALAVSCTAGASVVGRLWVGMFAGRFSLRQLAATCFIVQSVALVVLALVQTPVALFTATIVFGLTIGNVYMLQSLITAECFGVATYGTVFGMVSVLTQLGSAAGPTIASAAVDIAGGYQTCFVALSLFGVAAAVLIAFARPVARPNLAELAAT